MKYVSCNGELTKLSKAGTIVHGGGGCGCRGLHSQIDCGGLVELWRILRFYHKAPNAEYKCMLVMGESTSSILVIGPGRGK